ncbi:Acyl-coenzyme A synthetases/AMP-(fatty) acid ligases [Rhodococcus wratislaviensis]|uniref:Acyl-coenzyme A synthetases/AMP-(Fatty) acid ligases n=1 Tax=Rhodococcus wratislaviensis TaxID=44752 RepID=A0A402C032_RHOWR|nr:AMP-binding protein [Rhodococcus wratislaviensis]GCE36953.1 Acyl-coenzyme A synthetases/AMP-(fatty) acid ligases [Rhodococcus wratislaviensis]
MLSRSAHIDTFCRDNLPPTSDWPDLRFDLPELAYPDRLNCARTLLDDAVAAWGPDRRCLLTPTEQWTYGALLRRANQIAQVLVGDHGLVPGQRVMLRGPNNPWLVACWFAVAKAGGVVVTTMPLLRNLEIAKLIELTSPALALCDHRFTEDMMRAAGDIPVIAFGGGGADDLIASAERKSGEFTNVDTAADDVVLLAPTSGTTGAPKATMHFHRDVLANADTFSRHVVKPEADDLFTGTPPLAFTFGLGGLMVFPMRVGAATLLLERATPAELADAVAKFGVSVLFTAPTAYRALLRENQADKLGSLRRCVSAGEHLPASVWHQFHDATGIGIINGIGGTEMLHVFISAADEDIRPGSTGKAVPGFYAEIHDENGQPVSDGTPGLLAVKGPTGCRYLADDRQKNYVREGWNLTGDTYTRDEHGYFWYHARSDDMIVSSGYNIAAPEVEEAIDKHPDVAESAVIGLPDDERGMIVHAAIVLRDGAVGDKTKIREIQDFVKQTAAPYKYPRSIVFLDRLPRTPSGKLQRFRLRDISSAVPS